MRIGTMIKQLLEEVRAAPLDEAGRVRLRGDPPALDQGAGGRVWRRNCGTSWSGCRCRSPTTPCPCEGELRIAQAQLVGWLEGVFHGLQAALVAQQMAARVQLEQMRRGQLPPGQSESPGGPLGASTGQYL